jgi:competence protein ComEC
MPPGRFYRRPIIPLTVALIAGIALGSEAPGWLGTALAVVLVCGLGVVRCLIRGRPAVVPPLMLFIALGYLSLQPWIQPRFPANHVSQFIDSGPWRIAGVVDDRPLEFESRSQFVLRVERLENGSETQAVSGLLRITASGETIDFAQGDRVALHSRINPIRNFNNPGGFDFKRSMAFREIWGSAFTGGAGVSLLEPRAKAGILERIDAVRSAIADRIDQAGLGPEAAVLKALVMGDSSGIEPNIRQAFTRTGTSHILAISGLHITIVATIAFGLFRWLLSWMPIALRHAWTRKGAAVLTLLPITLYALIAGFSPSTQRALIMVAAFLLAFLAERETDLLNTLALAALLILCVQPAALFSISFQLSFAAVLAIVYAFERLEANRSAVASVLADGWDGRAARIKRSLMAFLGVSLVATWGTLPLGAYYFNNVALIGLLANCIAIPLLGYVVVAVGLIGTLLAALSTPAAVMCYQAGGFVVSKSIALIEWMAGFPYAAVRTVSPSLTEMALFYVLSWAVFHLATDRSLAASVANSTPSSKDTPARGPGPGILRPLLRTCVEAIGRASPGRRAAWAVLVVSLIGAGVDAGYWIYQRFGRQDLRVTMIDVGQGSAVLLEFPGGATALIDGGGFADPAAFDVGARVVAPFLWRRKIATIDTMVLTHANSDHVNGLVFIADNFQVRELWTNGESRPILGYDALMQAAARRGIAVPGFSELPRESSVNGARIEVLYPPGDFLERRRTEHWRRDENNNSLVTRVSLGEVAVLIPGDIMRPAEKELVALAGERLRSTVLIAPHHGSRSSSSEEFIRVVAPEVVLVSCAERSRSGIPHPQVLQRYESGSARVYRTDRHGAVHLATDGSRVAITPFLNSN